MWSLGLLDNAKSKGKIKITYDHYKDYSIRLIKCCLVKTQDKMWQYVNRLSHEKRQEGNMQKVTVVL